MAKHTASSKSLKIGKIEVPMGSGLSPYVPQHAAKFVDHDDILKHLAIGVRDNLAMLLIGESGIGKTHAIRYLAHQTHNGLRRINLNGGTTADELVGKWVIENGNTRWIDGPLTESMRTGEWIVLDEINAALPEVLFVLQSVLDDDGYLVLVEKDGELVQKHPSFRLFATCNPPEYAGTKEMNQALLSRFALCLSVGYPSPGKETEIIEHHLGQAVAHSELAQKLISLANDTRTAKEQNKADFALNTRDILNALRLTAFIEPLDALRLAFANKLNSVDAKALENTARLHLPQKKKTLTGQLKPVADAKSLVEGTTYQVASDMQEVYLAVGQGKKHEELLGKTQLSGLIRSGNTFTHATKGDEFELKSFYLETGGARVASLVHFTHGPNKGQHGVVIHHERMNHSDKIFNELYEKC